MVEFVGVASRAGSIKPFPGALLSPASECPQRPRSGVTPLGRGCSARSRQRGPSAWSCPIRAQISPSRCIMPSYSGVDWSPARRPLTSVNSRDLLHHK